MARSDLVFFFFILLSVSLLASSNLLPLRRQENNEDGPVILQDAFEQRPLLRLPSERGNQMMMEVRSPPATHNRFSASREGESDSIFRPTEGEGDSVSPLIGGESDSILLGRGGEGEEGRKDSRFGRPGAGCHHHHHGGEMKFGHFRGDHPRIHPHFLVSFILTSPEDASSFRHFPREFRPRAEKEEHKHVMHQRSYENERFGFEPQERVFERRRGFPERENVQFERIGKDLPEREHTHSHGHSRWEREFRNGKDFPEREHTQFEHTEKGFPEREHTHSHGHGRWEREFWNGNDFPEFEQTGRGFPEREHTHSHGHGQWEREFRNGNDFPEFEHTGRGFPEREHTHSHGHGPWEREFRNEERQKHGRHEMQEDPASPWMDWLRSLLPRQ